MDLEKKSRRVWGVIDKELTEAEGEWQKMKKTNREHGPRSSEKRRRDKVTDPEGDLGGRSGKAFIETARWAWSRGGEAWIAEAKRQRSSEASGQASEAEASWIGAARLG